MEGAMKRRAVFPVVLLLVVACGNCCKTKQEIVDQPAEKPAKASPTTSDHHEEVKQPAVVEKPKCTTCFGVSEQEWVEGIEDVDSSYELVFVKEDTLDGIPGKSEPAPMREYESKDGLLTLRFVGDPSNVNQVQVQNSAWGTKKKKIEERTMGFIGIVAGIAFREDAAENAVPVTSFIYACPDWERCSKQFAKINVSVIKMSDLDSMVVSFYPVEAIDP
jgi:hypothetical protein